MFNKENIFPSQAQENKKSSKQASRLRLLSDNMSNDFGRLIKMNLNHTQYGQWNYMMPSNGSLSQKEIFELPSHLSSLKHMTHTQDVRSNYRPKMNYITSHKSNNKKKANSSKRKKNTQTVLSFDLKKKIKSKNYFEKKINKHKFSLPKKRTTSHRFNSETVSPRCNLTNLELFTKRMSKKNSISNMFSDASQKYHSNVKLSKKSKRNVLNKSLRDKKKLVLPLSSKPFDTRYSITSKNALTKKHFHSIDFLNEELTRISDGAKGGNFFKKKNKISTSVRKKKISKTPKNKNLYILPDQEIQLSSSEYSESSSCNQNISSKNIDIYSYKTILPKNKKSKKENLSNKKMPIQSKLFEKDKKKYKTSTKTKHKKKQSSSSKNSTNKSFNDLTNMARNKQKKISNHKKENIVTKSNKNNTRSAKNINKPKSNQKEYFKNIYQKLSLKIKEEKKSKNKNNRNSLNQNEIDNIYNKCSNENSNFQTSNLSDCPCPKKKILLSMEVITEEKQKDISESNVSDLDNHQHNKKKQLIPEHYFPDQPCSPKNKNNCVKINESNSQTDQSTNKLDQINAQLPINKKEEIPKLNINKKTQEKESTGMLSFSSGTNLTQTSFDFGFSKFSICECNKNGDKQKQLTISQDKINHARNLFSKKSEDSPLPHHNVNTMEVKEFLTPLNDDKSRDVNNHGCSCKCSNIQDSDLSAADFIVQPFNKMDTYLPPRDYANNNKGTLGRFLDVGSN